MKHGQHRIFFLFPQSVIFEDVVLDCISEEYEAYIVRHPASARQLIKREQLFMLFINIDSGLEEEEWIDYVQEIKNNPDVLDLYLGILTFRTREDLTGRYKEMGCSVFNLGEGMEVIQKKIMDTIRTVTGKRHKKGHISVTFKGRHRIHIILRDGQITYRGRICALSSLGMSALILGETQLPKDLFLEEIKVIQKKKSFFISGTVAGYSEENRFEHVFTFHHQDTAQEKREISNLIHLGLQLQLEKRIISLDPH